MSRNSNLPFYLQIKNELKRRILSGRLAPGDKLPSESELAKEFEVSPSTVKRAIEVLASDQLVERTPGRGTFISAPTGSLPLRSFTEEMRLRGLVPGNQLLEKSVVSATGELAWHLDVPEGSKLFFIRRLHTANDVPVALEDSYIPQPLCPDLLDNNLQVLSLDEILEENYGVTPLRADDYVSARPAASAEMILLQAETPIVLITVERVIEGYGRQRIRYDQTRYRADRYILHFRLQR